LSICRLHICTEFIRIVQPIRRARVSRKQKVKSFMSLNQIYVIHQECQTFIPSDLILLKDMITANLIILQPNWRSSVDFFIQYAFISLMLSAQNTQKTRILMIL
jgi:hypothetical protein